MWQVETYPGQISRDDSCKECDAGTYSFNGLDRCEPAVCNTRDCTICPVGVTCSKGSDQTHKHFVPKPILVGDKVHPIASVQRQGAVDIFYCAVKQGVSECKPIDLSVPIQTEAHKADDGTYLWEYVESCRSSAQPCSELYAPSVLLRRCPAGTMLINSTQVKGFDPSLQMCQPCGVGFYVVDSFHGPCIECKFSWSEVSHCVILLPLADWLTVWIKVPTAQYVQVCGSSLVRAPRVYDSEQNTPPPPPPPPAPCLVLS